MACICAALIRAVAGTLVFASAPAWISPASTAAAQEDAQSRPLPGWPYNESRFPAAWFGAQPLRFENATEVAALGRYSLVLFGWQALQLFENYTDVMQAQVEQARRIKKAHAGVPVFVYTPVEDTQPYYRHSRPLFVQRERYKDMLLLGSSTNSSDFFQPKYKCIGPHSNACINCEVNFWNSSSLQWFESFVTALAQQDGFDGIFFDGGEGMLMNGGAKWRGAANAPAGATEDQALTVQVEITKRAIAAAAAHGKYPMFNLGIKHLNYTKGPWSSYISQLNGLGLFRYYEGQFGYPQWMENAVREMALPLPTHLHTNPNWGINDSIAKFLIIKSPYYYFSASTNYFDSGFVWHREYEADYGTALHKMPATTATKNGGVAYEREYTKCIAHVICPPVPREPTQQPPHCNGTIMWK